MNTPVDQFVSVIIPCRNEINFIAKCLDSVRENDYPTDLLEVLVVDGMSEDGTRDVIQKMSSRYPYIKLLDNPNRITPCALNVGLKYARGSIVIRMDAHASYPAHFVSTAVRLLNTMPVDVVGGPVVTLSKEQTLIAESIALATSHPFGVGNSKFRTSATEGYVDTVPFGAYRKTVFDRVGLFNEKLVRNQDNEMSSRITQSGGKIYFTPELKAYYYNQSTLAGLLRQAFRTGAWNITTIEINPGAFRVRHFIPFLFVSALTASGLLSLAWGAGAFVAGGILLSYSLVSLLSTLQLVYKNGVKYVVVLPPLFFLYHISYGMGTWSGIANVLKRSFRCNSLDCTREG